ncbi:hypothetical protein ADL07_11365 [Streptomyces sp. NRRL F-4707]|uniref:hypothetical protein n=1 Tax=Streptomyces sp. NRRL F-4707 TaxID=1519496 RepID=UPI0006B06C5D|nr:hypothetical protein [Streptomyces sp. NRRL F-4707]KOX32770.1 hypothetical protein ADL07_11365 [Streptomyces sp. NRRL F-4707]
MTAGRYRVTVTTGGQPLIQGWWGSEVIARRKFTAWVGEHGDRPGARVTLVDEETGETLTEWPDGR